MQDISWQYNPLPRVWWLLSPLSLSPCLRFTCQMIHMVPLVLNLDFMTTFFHRWELMKPCLWRPSLLSFKVDGFFRFLFLHFPGLYFLFLVFHSFVSLVRYLSKHVCRLVVDFRMMSRFGKSLISIGFAPHRCINIIGFNSVEWFIANIGAIAAGGIAAGIYTSNLPEVSVFLFCSNFFVAIL